MATTTPLTPALSALASPGVNLGSYIQAVNNVALLSADEEKSLAERLFFEQDVEAARQLVLSHLRFVVHIARSYAGYGLPQADLIQEGNIGLMKAVKRFDPRMGVRLVSFAVHWIKAEIHEFVIKNWRIVKVATTKAQRKLFFNLRSMRKGHRLSMAEANAIATDLNVTPEQVLEMELRLASYDMTFDYTPDDDDEHSSSSPVHYLEDGRYDPARILEEQDHEDHENGQLQEALAQLDERSRDILTRRWLRENDKATLHELAAEYGVSAERVRQIEKSAMEKLKKTLLPQPA